MLAAVRAWAAAEAPRQPGLLRLGLFGSYARGDAGVGSDLDLVAIVRDSRERFDARAVHWRTEALPLPAELLVFTAEEWDRLRLQGGRFARMVERETVWLYPCPAR